MIGIRGRSILKALKIRQIERITAEAWRQDAVLTTLDLEWLLGIPPTMIRELLEAYQAKFSIVLSTAGTVLDMGRTLTHKALVVELALDSLSTREISRRIYHTPEAVDAYLRVFDRAVMLRYFGVPPSAMPRITGHSPGLLKEHLELIEKHLPTREAMASYLLIPSLAKPAAKKPTPARGSRLCIYPYSSFWPCGDQLKAPFHFLLEPISITGRCQD